MGLLNDYKTNKDLEKTGVWEDLGGYRIKLRRSGGRNASFTKEQTKITKPYRRAILRGTADEDQLQKALAPAYAKHVLVDFDGVVVTVTTQDDVGLLDRLGVKHEGLKDEPYDVAITYNPQVAEKLLLELPDFYEDVRIRSGDIGLFQGDETEVAAGN